MKVARLDDRENIHSFLSRNIPLHIYAIGDLDDFFWNYTEWYGLLDGNKIEEVAMLYSGAEPPVLLALSDSGERMSGLLASILPRLPDRLYAHLGPGTNEIMGKKYEMKHHGLHLKMILSEKSRLEGIDTSAAVPLTTHDLREVENLYEESYPGNVFDPRMLETGFYYGIRTEGRLASVAGVHVYSRKYGVAALGNITTLPAMRGRGLARTVSAGLCRALLETVDHIGLNVKADNEAALGLYRGLGFTVAAEYDEFLCEKK